MRLYGLFENNVQDFQITYLDYLQLAITLHWDSLSHRRESANVLLVPTLLVSAIAMN